jgi:hypothetical protein
MDVDVGYLIAWVILTALGACLAFLVTWSFSAACAAAVFLWLAAGILAWADRE